MATDNVRAFVIRSIDYGETSKIITLFSKENGIISAMAKGVKTAKSKKMNLCSQFTQANFELTKKGDFYFLKDGEILSDNSQLLKSIEKIYLAQLIFDLVEKTIVLNEENKDIYALVEKTLKYISISQNMIRVANMFLIKYISMIGFKPNLKFSKENYENSLYFSYELGAVTSKRLFETDKAITLKEFAYFQSILIEIFENIDIIEGGLNEKRIFNLIIEFLRYNTDVLMPKSYTNFTKIVGIE